MGGVRVSWSFFFIYFYLFRFILDGLANLKMLFLGGRTSLGTVDEKRIGMMFFFYPELTEEHNLT